MKEKYAETLSKMISHETISEIGQTDVSKFREFHQLLKELFPSIFSACELWDYDGSLLLRWPGKNTPEPNNQGLLLMNHMDVVEAKGDWKYPPFSGEIAEGKVWGRGTLDDKGPLWGMLQAADELAEEGFVPERDIWFESACTEEIAGTGAETVARLFEEKGFKFDLVLDEGGMILTEPISGAKGTFAMVGVGEKGCADLKFIARSAGGHASAPPKNTPLVRLGKFMSYIDRNEIFDIKLPPTICEMLRRMAPHMSGITAKAMADPEKYAPIIKKVINKSGGTAAALTKTTVAFTRAQGSGGNNVIPDEAYVIGNMRFSHHQGRESSFKMIEKIAKRYDIEMEVMDPGIESGITDWKGDAFKIIEEGVKVVFPGVETSPYIMTGGSDARYMRNVSDNCIRFAPFHITGEQMSSIHAINECIDVDALEPAVEFYKYIIKKF